MTQAVEDGATRPVYYESRVIKLHLDKDTLALIDATYDALEQQSDTATIEKNKKMLGQMESVLGADSTVQSLCEDIVTHYEKYRANLLTGKAMIVAYSRPIAMKIYRKLLELRPAWKEKIGVVMTSGNNDPEDWKAIIGTKSHKEELARKFKDASDAGDCSCEPCVQGQRGRLDRGLCGHCICPQSCHEGIYQARPVPVWRYGYFQSCISEVSGKASGVQGFVARV